jgi:hypothetical protein
VALDDNKKERCKVGDLKKQCDNFVRTDVISQFEQVINSEDLGTNNDGNLTEILEQFRPNKMELFQVVCNMYHDCELNSLTGWKLDCFGAILGLNRNLCDKGVLTDEAYLNVIKNRTKELGNPFQTFKKLQEHLEDIFGAGSFELCRTDGCINIFMKRSFTADEEQFIQAYLDSIPVPLNECVKLYPDDIVKCLYLQYDPADPQQGGLNEALMNCGDKKDVYTRSSAVTGDESEDITKCLVLNAPYFEGTAYGFYGCEWGLNSGAINCSC